MRTEKTKDNGTKEGCADFGCCDPGNFKKMFEMMNKCCPDQSNSTDFSAMMSGMMKNMMKCATDQKQRILRWILSHKKSRKRKGAVLFKGNGTVLHLKDVQPIKTKCTIAAFDIEKMKP